MSTLDSHLTIALQALMQPVALLTVLVGALAGGLVAPLLRRIGMGAAAALALAIPVTSQMEPAASMMLLGAMLVAALGTGTQAPGDDWHWREALRGPGMALAVAAAVVLAGAPLAGALQGLEVPDKVAVLVMAAAVAVILVAIIRLEAWLPTLLLMIAAAALQASPFALTYGEHDSPLPLLLGVLVLGPALAALVWPGRLRDTAPLSPTSGLAATMLPVFLIGAPVTAGAALLAQNLNEMGLAAGPGLLAQRPKALLGLLAAVVGASLLVGVGRRLTSRVTRPDWWPEVVPDQTRRLAAGVLVLLVAAVLYMSGLEVDKPWNVVVATVAAAALAWVGIDAAPFVITLVICDLIQAALTVGADDGPEKQAFSVSAISKPLLVVAALTLVTAVLWPLIVSRTLARATPPPTAPSDPAAS